jgi:hypothetical protein
MKLPTFVDALNGSQSPTPWEADSNSTINNGYPILSWQAPADQYWTGYAASGYAGGNGLKADTAYMIETPAQLALLAQNSIDSAYSYGKYFILTADIDLSGHNWKPIASFSGSLDGQGHVIRNMKIDSNADWQGLIANAGAGVVLKHLTLEACDIKTTGSFAGALLARFEQPGTFTALDCHSSGSVTGNQYVGGLFGQINGFSGPLIIDCSSSCNVSATVTGTGNYGFAGGLIGRSLATAANPSDGNQLSGSFATGTVSGNGCIGGLIGESSSTAFLNCYATGAVSDTGGVCASGFVGLAYNTTVTNCYTCGSVTPEIASNGGIIGNASAAEPLLSITNSYYTGVLQGVGGGISKTPSEMKDAAFVATLNGSQSPAIWIADTGINGGFPILRWQAPVITAPVLHIDL